MKKTIKILAGVCFIVFTATAFSQEKADDYKKNLKFGVGLNLGYPFNDPYNFNLGGDIRLQYNISGTYSICLTSGYNNLFVKNDEPNFGYIPIKVGYKSFIFNNEFYVMGEMGGAFSTTKAYSNNSLLFCPSVGYGTKYVDISVRYEFLKDFPIVKDNVVDNGLGQVMIRLAYGFDL